MKAIIIGGGIAGLAAALALTRRGWQVEVFEREPEFTEAGAGLSLWSNALRALDALGVGEPVRSRATPAGQAGIRDAGGRWLSRSDTAELERRYGPVVMIHRADLLAVLLAAVPEQALRPGVTVAGVRPDGTVLHSGGQSRADLVVGADGVHSVTRRAVWPDAPAPRYAGYTSWRLVTGPVPVTEASESWGRGERFGYARLPDGRIYCYATANAPQGAPGGGLAELARRFGSWHDPIPALLAAVGPGAVLHHDLYELPPLHTYTAGRVVLAGDAAHAMTPNLGQGACQALEDAVVLGDVTASGAGLAAYDRQRRPRTQMITRRSRRLGAAAQWASPAAVHLRDTTLRLLPPHRSSGPSPPSWTGPPDPPRTDHPPVGQPAVPTTIITHLFARAPNRSSVGAAGARCWSGGNMAWKRSLVAAVAITAAIPPAAGCGRSAQSSENTSPSNGLVSTTRPGTSQVGSVTWAVYRDVNSLDPIFAFDYPENTADSLMCESLLRQAPDGAVVPGLASMSQPSPTRLVFTIRPGVTFWDGHPVTPADVVYSLGRDMNVKLGGFYAVIFDRVRSIAATGPRQVTITLTQPDYWLPDQMASIGGIVIEKSFAQKQGQNYGTPAGGIMCTGAYMLKSWKPGVGVLAVANAHYWNPAVHPLVQQILIKGVPDVAILTAALETGAIQGTYSYGLSTLDQLKSSRAVKVYEGPGWSTDAFVVSSLTGVLGDVRVRRALSMALDRRGIIGSVYRGAALMPRWLSNPGTFGYASDIFEAAYNSSPVLTQNIPAARRLVQEAGATDKTLTIGTSSGLADVAAVTGAYQAAAEAIGLKIKLDAVSAQNYIDFFIDPKFRVGVDGFMSINYGDWADPVAMLRVFEQPGGVENYDNFNDPAITSLLERERATADPAERARLVVQLEKLTLQQLPMIPTAQPVTLLLLNKSLTGAVASFAYMFSPWADSLGGTG